MKAKRKMRLSKRLILSLLLLIASISPSKAQYQTQNGNVTYEELLRALADSGIKYERIKIAYKETKIVLEAERRLNAYYERENLRLREENYNNQKDYIKAIRRERIIYVSGIIIILILL